MVYVLFHAISSRYASETDLCILFVKVLHPFAKGLTPFVKVSTPFAKVSTPFAKVSTPFAKVFTPFAKVSTPFAKVFIPQGVRMKVPTPFAKVFNLLTRFPHLLGWSAWLLFVCPGWLVYYILQLQL